MKQEHPLLYILPILWESKKLIVWTTITTAILAALIMLLKPNYYRSSAQFYPINTALLSPIVDLKNQQQGYYGNNKDVDRFLTIGHSKQLATHIIEKFDLAEHYGIDAKKPKGLKHVYFIFNKCYTIQKTKYDAIEVSVEDTDPEQARLMVSAIVDYIDNRTDRINKTSQSNILSTLKKNIDEHQSQLKTITDSIKTLRQVYGIYDTEAQAEAIAAMEIERPADPRVKKMINEYNKGIAEVMRLEVAQQTLSKSLVFEQIDYDQVNTTYQKKKSTIHLIEEATAPLEKYRPNRTLYVLGAAIFVFLVSCLLVIIRSQLKSTIPKV